MGKLLLIAGPLALYAAAYGVRALFGKRPSTQSLNVELALLLVVYFLATAGLGVFWVANQQLPPFDFHYLFGYATLCLVVAHLVLNARTIFAYLQRGPRPASEPVSRAVAGKLLVALLLAGGAFFLGLRAGSPRLPTSFSGAGDASLSALEQYHAVSSHSREGVVLRAPSVAWELPVASFIDRTDRPQIALDEPDPSALPPRRVADALAGVARTRGGRFDKRDLSTVLWASAGITERRGGFDLRASASSGALFPTELYVLAYDVAGLSPAVYAYVPERHALADLGIPLQRDARIGLGTSSDGPPLAIAVTSVLRRTGQKYRDRAYRYAVADAGHAVGNTLVAAAELGMATEVVAGFDDAVLAKMIGVDNEREAVVALVALHANGAPRGAPLAGLFAPRQLPDVDALELGATGLAHAATSLTWVGSESREGAEERTLPAPASPQQRPLQLIAKRRSARNFAATALQQGAVSSVLVASVGAPARVSHAVRAYLVAGRVDGIDPGTLRYDASRNVLARTTHGDVAAGAGRAALDQDVVGMAPATVVLTLDRRALRSEGARGYRHAFLEAGIVGARLYLASAAAGLGGCSVGAFYDGEVAELLGIDLAEEWPIHFFALGVPE